MTQYATRLFLNPQAQVPKDYGPTQQAQLNQQAFAAAKTEITSWPGYKPTPLLALNNLAAVSGVNALWCKHEGFRFGIGSFKPTGPTYAMLIALKSQIQRITGISQIATADLVEGKYQEITQDTVVAAATRNRPSASLHACGCFLAFSMSLTVISPIQW